MKKFLPVFLSCQGYRLSDEEKHLFAKYRPLGVCLFAKYCDNIKDPEQINLLVNDIRQAVESDEVLIAVDQEGGRVRRLTEPQFTSVTAPQNLTTEELAFEHAYLISHDLKLSGINVNFAPVLDIMTEKTSAALSGRCLPNNIPQLAKVMTDEYIKQGVCPCVKHMPGHGRAESDPHLELPVIKADLKELQKDFAPFKALNDVPMGMVAHIVLTAIDKERAATLSPIIIKDIIREQIGFKGLLVSDAIVMKALKGTIAERAKQAIAAGCDVICLGNADFETNRELCESGIILSDEAEERLKPVWNIINKTGDFSQYKQVKNKYCESLKNIVSYDYQYDATEVLNRLRKQ
ncbi:MAG: glycoside hydrolase family 3 protein [Alphaproteobacteria bacterium]|nr:glycoside hydrolase family 3 protein [Alphaproteobacteria bacterium]